MHPEKEEPRTESNTAPAPADCAVQRRKWQPPKGEIVEVAAVTRAGIAAGIDGISCHS